MHHHRAEHRIVLKGTDLVTKAKQKLGWVPKITAQEMCAEMAARDLAQAKQYELLKANVSVE